jgi:hypothetical protein
VQPATTMVMSKPSKAVVSQEPTHCCCSTCTDAVWNTLANGYSCGSRITYLQSTAGGSNPEFNSCFTVAGVEYPTECGQCDPLRCDKLAANSEKSGKSSEHTYCSCSTCTEEVWDSNAGGRSCGSRISYWLQAPQSNPEFNSCFAVAGSEYPAECGQYDPLTCDSKSGKAGKSSKSEEPTYCSCSTCTEDVWNTLANGYICGSRVSFLLTPNRGSNSVYNACQQVAGSKYPTECGQRDPSKCNALVGKAGEASGK